MTALFEDSDTRCLSWKNFNSLSCGGKCCSEVAFGSGNMRSSFAVISWFKADASYWEDDLLAAYCAFLIFSVKNAAYLSCYSVLLIVLQYGGSVTSAFIFSWASGTFFKSSVEISDCISLGCFGISPTSSDDFELCSFSSFCSSGNYDSPGLRS